MKGVRKMKKKFLRATLIASMIISTICLSGCGDENSANKQEVVTDSKTDNADSKYVFKSGDKTIYIGQDGKEVLEILGEANETFTATSCAFDGEDHMYMYNSYQITLSTIEGTERLAAITLTDDGVATPEGIRIGSSEETVIEALSVEKKEDGLYSVTSGKTKLSVTVKDGAVIAINYAYITE